MNYFEYFSEIEERFSARRGSVLLLSTLDWALIETWREAGIPLAAVLRGIDQAFDKHEQRKARAKGRIAKVNGLAWCAQAVMEAAVELAEAAVGGRSEAVSDEESGTGFEAERVARYLEANATTLRTAASSSQSVQGIADRLRGLADEVREGHHAALEHLDRILSVLDEQLRAGLLASLPEAELFSLREAVDREVAPYRSKLGAVQMRQLRDQFLHRKLFETRNLPRLSLFYMPVGGNHDETPPESETA